jgi:Ca2+-binding RTX toxin-like protein
MAFPFPISSRCRGLAADNVQASLACRRRFTKGVLMPTTRIEVLESRLLRSATLNNGVLNVAGTANDDRVYVYPNHAGTGIDVKINNRVSSFDLSAVQSIVISGRRGDDTIKIFEDAAQIPSTVYGDGGHDDVEVHSGATHIYGGSGNDRLQAAWIHRRAVIYGESGNDTILSGYGRDLLNGGDGNDTLDGWAGNNTIDCGAGDDIVQANDGDTYGFTGDDLIQGGDGNDTLLADAGNDSLDGGAGTDTLTGGPGKDVTFGVDVAQALSDPDAEDAA